MSLIHPPSHRLARWASGLIVVLAGCIGSVNAQPRDTDVGADAPGASEPCGSPVLIHCDRSVDRLGSDDSFSASARRARQQMEARRHKIYANGNDLENIEITGERVPDANEKQWQKFGESVQSGAVGNCLAPRESSMGLLSVPVLAYQAATGRCR